MRISFRFLMRYGGLTEVGMGFRVVEILENGFGGLGFRGLKKFEV